MRHGAELAKVEIVAVVVKIHSACFHCGNELAVISFSFGAADDLTDTGNEKVGGGNRLTVGILLHIERLDILGIVGKEYGLLIDLLGDIALVLGLKVKSPLYGVFKLHARRLELIDRGGVVNDSKIVFNNAPQFIKQTLFEAGFEEGKLLGAFLHHVTDNVLDHFLGDLDDIGKLGEGDLGLDMPELRNVAGGVAVLCTEGGTEGVDLTKSHSGDLALKLTRNRETRTATEEVVCVVLLGVLIFGVIADGGYLEHLACALTVGAGEKRGVNVGVVILLEIAVECRRHHRAHAKDGVEGVGTHTDMGDLAKRFKLLEFLLEGIVRRTVAKHLHGLCVDLHTVAVHCLNDSTDHSYSGAEMICRVGRGNGGFVDNDL